MQLHALLAALMATGTPKAAVAIMLTHRVLCGLLTAGLTTLGLLLPRRQTWAALRGETDSTGDETPLCA